MKQFFAVFEYEMGTYLKKRPFQIVTLLLMVLIAVGLTLPRFFASSEESSSTGLEGQFIAVVASDKMGVTSEQLSAMLNQSLGAGEGEIFQPYSGTREKLMQDVEEGNYNDGLLFDSFLQYTRITGTVSLYDQFSAVLQEVLLQNYRAQAMAESGMSQEQVQQILSAQVQETLEQTESGKNQANSYLFTYLLIMLLYMAIIFYGQMVASSVATEKSSRAMELLITSARPSSLMFGKVFGAGCAGLLQFVLILGTAYGAYQINEPYYTGAMSVMKSLFNLPVETLLFALVCFVMGFFIYAFMFAALASLVSRLEDLSNVITPATMLFVVVFFIVIVALNTGEVDTPLMIACSYIPLTSPMAMFVRFTMGEVAVWEVAVSVVLMAAGAAALGYLGAAIYRVGVLMYGKPPKLSGLFAMLKNQQKI
ncbi:MAG TPA: ABC transporter permease [Candidatus Gallacutalibacter pullistercoris]|nr:ABC transporter permease [Candidatus Gallacutalibacter pullistercoris]